MTDVDAPAAAAPAGEFRHAFRIGTRWLLIPLGMPAEVYPPLPCARLPFTQHWCLGLASFRGDVAPVYDLAALLGERSANPSRYLLALGRREACAALGIDDITGITVPPDTPTTPPPPLPEPLSELAQHSLTVDAVPYLDSDLGGLLVLLAQRACQINFATLTSESVR